MYAVNKRKYPSIVWTSAKRKKKEPEPEESDDITAEDFENLIRNKVESALNPFKEFKGKKNHVYFTEDITKKSCRDLIERIEEVTIRIQKLSSDYDMESTPKIYLHISSPGGDIFPTFGVMDVIRRSKIPIVTIIEGAAASGATLISLMGSERWITQNSYMLIHQLNGGFWGTFSEMEDEMLNKKEWMERIIKVYEEKTKMKSADLRNLLKHDLYWNAEECLKRGLADKIV